MLIDTGRAFAVEAEPFAEEFAKHGVSIEALTATVDALEEAIRTGVNARSARKTSRKTWTSTLEEALMNAKRLDVLVATTITDPGTLVAYALARTVHHVGYKTAETNSTEVPPPSTTAPAALAATANVA
jgi:hypothetical protein